MARPPVQEAGFSVSQKRHALGENPFLPAFAGQKSFPPNIPLLDKI